MTDHEDRAPVSLRGLPADDPHLQPLAQNPGYVEKWIVVLFILGFAGFVGFGWAYWVAAQPWKLGATLGGGMFFIGMGLVAWGKYLMPRGPFVEDRHDLSSTDEDRVALASTLVDRGGAIVQRRKVLGGLLGAGLGTFSIVALFPLLRSLGPTPKQTLDKTNWTKGAYLVDVTGQRIHKDDLTVGSVVSSVFPEGYQDDEDDQAEDQTIVIRISTENYTTKHGRETWGPEGYLAFSKMCTHLGCPVGLYEQQLQLLVCPCHQSMFDVANGCTPEFGPAPRPLPQLPIYIDGDGYLRAQSGYLEPVGPGFWERS